MLPSVAGGSRFAAENVFRVSSLEGQEHGQELLLVADENRVGDDRQLTLHGLLDRDGSNVLTSGRDQEFLDSPCVHISKTTSTLHFLTALILPVLI